MSQGLVRDPPGQAGFAGMPQRLYSASPSRLLAFLDCPRRYRMSYLDRPRPLARPQRAHTSIGLATHNALRDYWDLPPARQTPDGGAELLRQGWIPVGFRDERQSATWRDRTADQVRAYLGQPGAQAGAHSPARPLGIERCVALKSAGLALQGRIDRLDERDGALVVVDYKTSRRPSTQEDARTSLPLALYAAAAARMFRRPGFVRVELHHIPTATVVGHDHGPQSLARKLAEASSIAADMRTADADHAARGADSDCFPPRPSPVCRWCDLRAHCAEGQRMGPEQPSWAALEPEDM
ncbi:MAG TPA: PD-(D/E)XK nuclease family protein [Dermatophilaceae bacterium]|nr:PD-(D/E)XK nuclease family protein [Dermatophilaceae bacterium]